MGFWNRLFGKADEPAPAAPPPAPPAASPLAKPPAAATLPLGQTNVGRLAEQFLRSYLILTGHAPGSRPQAQAFDDWLESYRDDPHKILAQAACHPGCAEAEVNIPGGKVFWWEIADPQTRFLCSFAGISGYAIPRNAAPVPTITDFTPPATPCACGVREGGHAATAAAGPTPSLCSCSRQTRSQIVRDSRETRR